MRGLAQHASHPHGTFVLALTVAVVLAWLALAAIRPWTGAPDLPVPAPIPALRTAR